MNFAILPIDFPEKKTVIAQVAQTVYGDGILFYLFQAFTALLLFLAANTSFNAFPRLLAILAGDGHMPRQFAFRGDRLAFSYGIIVLASLAAGSDHHLQGVDAPAHPPVRGRRLHRLHDQPDRHDPPLAAREVARLSAPSGDQRVRRHPDRDRRRDRHRGEVLRRSLDRPCADPDPGRGHVVHRSPVRRPGRGAARPRRRDPPRAASRTAGRSSRSTASTARSSRRSTSDVPSQGTYAPST